MDKDVVADLKQFIAGAITQQTSDIRQDTGLLDGRVANLETRMGGLEAKVGNLDAKVDTLNQKIDEGFLGIAEALEGANDNTETLQKDFNKRLIGLERKAA
jgi:hypothetical protein